MSRKERHALAEMTKPIGQRDYSTSRGRAIHALEHKGLLGREGSDSRRVTAAGRAELASPDMFDDLFKEKPDRQVPTGDQIARAVGAIQATDGNVPKSTMDQQQEVAFGAGVTWEEWASRTLDGEVHRHRTMLLCDDCRRTIHREVDCMVSDILWIVYGTGRGMLCLPCLERRMGRPVRAIDLKLCGLTLMNPRLRRMIEHEMQAFAHRVPPERHGVQEPASDDDDVAVADVEGKEEIERLSAGSGRIPGVSRQQTADAQPTDFVPRIAHLEQDIEPDPATDSLLSPRQPRFRWACDLCRGLQRGGFGAAGRWTGEDRANDEADAHDRWHARQRKSARERAARGTREDR